MYIYTLISCTLRDTQKYRVHHIHSLHSHMCTKIYLDFIHFYQGHWQHVQFLPRSFGAFHFPYGTAKLPQVHESAR